MRRATSAAVACLIVAVLAAACVVTPARGAAAPKASGRLRALDGTTPFVVGASYQGPADRAWRGDYWAWWADDRFDASLVQADFERAATAGFNTIRIFVQRELLHDIRDDDWHKLDAVVDLAGRSGLRLIIVFGDYDELRVERVAKTSATIAKRYAGNPTILAYELKNEPTFWMLEATRYPDNQRPPLQSTALVEHYGERAARHYVAAFRESDEGQRGPLAIPGWMSDDEAYYWHNNWLLSFALSQEASEWATANGRTDIEYFGTPEAAHWQFFLDAVDQTYQAWLEPQLRLIHEADPGRPIGVGHHDPIMSVLPANRQLDYLSPHRYPSIGYEGVASQVQYLRALRTLYPDKPILMGEFGHRTTEPGESRAAVDEAAVFLDLYANGYAGGLKWLLTDTRDGTDSMGAFRMDGTPKPITTLTAALGRLAQANDVISARFDLGADTTGGVCYTFRAAGLVLAGGACAPPADASADARLVIDGS